MTPTLLGRLQTRIFLNIFVSLPILLISGYIIIFPVMLLLGICLDFLYDHLQHKRWDGDWPPILIFIAGVFEGLLLWGLVSLIIELGPKTFFATYTFIFLVIFMAQLWLLNILFPYRRFRGGKII